VAESARWAPTGANSQCWDLIIVDDPTVRDAVIDILLSSRIDCLLRRRVFQR